MSINNIPKDVADAAERLSRWAEEQNIKRWRIGGVQSARPIEEALYTKTDLSLSDFNLDQWWAHELAGLWGDGRYQVTDDTRRAARVALNLATIALSSQPSESVDIIEWAKEAGLWEQRGGVWMAIGGEAELRRFAAKMAPQPKTFQFTAKQQLEVMEPLAELGGGDLDFDKVFAQMQTVLIAAHPSAQLVFEPISDADKKAFIDWLEDDGEQ